MNFYFDTPYTSHMIKCVTIAHIVKNKDIVQGLQYCEQIKCVTSAYKVRNERIERELQYCENCILQHEFLNYFMLKQWKKTIHYLMSNIDWSIYRKYKIFCCILSFIFSLFVFLVISKFCSIARILLSNYLPQNKY